MPRFIINSSSKAPKHDKLVKRLSQELKSPGSDPQPLILEQEIPTTHSRHVHVIWDEWKRIPDEERSRVIVGAYQEAEGSAVAEQITIAAGVTPEESLALGLLSWKIAWERPWGESKEPTDEVKKALKAEARKTVLGVGAKELRYARAEDAEEVRKRLRRIDPSRDWIVVEEVSYEA